MKDTTIAVGLAKNVFEIAISREAGKVSVKRPRLSKVDRVFWVLLRRIWTDWEGVLVIVKPETVVRWHRCGFRRYWTWKSRRRRPGRPGVAPEIRELIRNMSRANPLWGAPRVHGELAKLGISISQAAVSKYMVRHRIGSSSCRTFRGSSSALLRGIGVSWREVP